MLRRPRLLLLLLWLMFLGIPILSEIRRELIRPSARRNCLRILLWLLMLDARIAARLRGGVGSVMMERMNSLGMRQ